MSGLGRHKVAVVEDDPGVRESLRFLLETAGYRVETYESACRFLAGAASLPFACLVVDQQMPVITGLEMIGVLRGRGSRIPTLLVTGSPSPALSRRARELGVTVLEKPLIDQDLLTHLGSVTG